MIIFDLDGTLADISQRTQHVIGPKKDWKKFFEDCENDKPNMFVVKIYYSLFENHEIQIWTGRHESMREITLAWLHNHCPRTSWVDEMKMRPNDDYTPDWQLKEKWLNEALAEGKQIEMVFEDRTRVVEMYRRHGIPCLQVCDGNY